jgi:putative redox protein
MATVSLQLLPEAQCEVTSLKSGATFITEAGGGLDRSFSATDLVAAGLGACIGAGVGRILERREIPLADCSIEVEKTMRAEPSRISELEVTIFVPVEQNDKLEKIILRAADACPVGRSLNSEITIAVAFITG